MTQLVTLIHPMKLNACPAVLVHSRLCVMNGEVPRSLRPSCCNTNLDGQHSDQRYR